MKTKRPCSTTLPALLILGMLSIWASAPVDARTVEPVSFSCGEMEEYFEEQLEEDARESLLALLQGDPVPEVRRVCFAQPPGTIKPLGFDYPSGWIMPLRI